MSRQPVSSGRRSIGDSAATRRAILDATAKIMREDGHAAVSSRRVAERAGLKSQLVHYHFGTMDDLFLALFRRYEDEFLTAEVGALTSSRPITELWKASLVGDKEIVAEFIALAMHRKTIREEIARANDRTRTIHTAAITNALQASGVDSKVFPPEVAAFLIAAVTRTLLTESALGVSSGHAATRAFIEQRLLALETGAPRRGESQDASIADDASRLMPDDRA